MCTLTWLRREDGYDLFFNRDELATRGPALAPRRERIGDTEVLAPTDSDAGGTWVAANSHGVSLGLLNGRSAYGPSPDFDSRGGLLRSLAHLGSTEEVFRALPPLASYRAFSLVVAEPGRELQLAEWDEGHLRTRTIADGERPLTSSSLDSEGVRESRARALAEMVGSREPTVAELERFHASHVPERGAFSPCMHREDGGTVSYTHVHVDSGEVTLAYTPAAPCRAVPSSAHRIERLPLRVAPAGG